MLLVGLGNIGSKYQYTRHNIGFLFINYLASYYNALKFSSGFKSEITTINLADKKLLLQKPSTFMNLSGDAVFSIKNYYKISNDDIIIIHDDINLIFLDVRYKTNSGDGGQKGIKDIHNKIGKDIHRIKLGIGCPTNKDTSSYVLSNFNKSELQKLPYIFEKMAIHLELLLKKDFNNFIQKIKEK